MYIQGFLAQTVINEQVCEQSAQGQVARGLGDFRAGICLSNIKAQAAQCFGLKAASRLMVWAH